jgi:hypothetical protein
MMGSRLKAEGLSLLSIGHAVVTVVSLECSVGATAQWCPTFQASVGHHNVIFLCLHLFSIVQHELQPTVPHVSMMLSVRHPLSWFTYLAEFKATDGYQKHHKKLTTHSSKVVQRPWELRDSAEMPTFH